MYVAQRWWSTTLPPLKKPEIRWQAERRKQHFNDRVKRVVARVDNGEPATFVTRRKRKAVERKIQKKYNRIIGVSPMRSAQIQRDNLNLIHKMVAIANDPRVTQAYHNSNRGFVSSFTLSRRREQRRIDYENSLMLQRLSKQRSTPAFYSHEEWEEQSRARERLLRHMCVYPYQIGKQSKDKETGPRLLQSAGDLSAQPPTQRPHARQLSSEEEQEEALRAQKGDHHQELPRSSSPSSRAGPPPAKPAHTKSAPTLPLVGSGGGAGNGKNSSTGAESCEQKRAADLKREESEAVAVFESEPALPLSAEQVHALEELTRLWGVIAVADDGLAREESSDGEENGDDDNDVTQGPLFAAQVSIDAVPCSVTVRSTATPPPLPPPSQSGFKSSPAAVQSTTWALELRVEAADSSETWEVVLHSSVLAKFFGAFPVLLRASSRAQLSAFVASFLRFVPRTVAAAAEEAKQPTEESKSGISAPRTIHGPTAIAVDLRPVAQLGATLIEREREQIARIDREKLREQRQRAAANWLSLDPAAREQLRRKYAAWL
jgi:hypothetical protein